MLWQNVRLNKYEKYECIGLLMGQELWTFNCERASAGRGL